jgi:hydroxyethylthiazole kinase-like sugar kinase family protein
VQAQAGQQGEVQALAGQQGEVREVQARARQQGEVQALAGQQGGVGWVAMCAGPQDQEDLSARWFAQGVQFARTRQTCRVVVI